MNTFENVRLGGLQQCNTAPICQALLNNLCKTDRLTIAEIGVGRGQTLRGLLDFVREQGFQNYLGLGIDWQDGPWDLFDKRQVGELLVGHPHYLYPAGSLKFFREHLHSLHFLHIDGCHSTACCTQDFVLAEPHIVPGGIVVFHDADRRCQGPDFDVQPHCGQGCQVRIALHCLGLLDNSRPRWELLHDIEGSDEPGPSFGRGSVIVRKTNTP